MPTSTEPEAVIRALDTVGVDFSVPKSALISWLRNSEFTPYPAIAAALLTLLSGRMLRRPVFIDVIVFNYEHSPGNPSPRRVEDVNLGVLEAAILEGFNERYGEENTEFRSLLRPQRKRSAAQRVQALSRSIGTKEAILPAIAAIWHRRETGAPSRNEFEGEIYTVFGRLGPEQHATMARAFAGYNTLRANGEGGDLFDDRLRNELRNRPLERTEFAKELVREGAKFAGQQLFRHSGGEIGPGQVRPWIPRSGGGTDSGSRPLAPWPWLTAIKPELSSDNEFGNFESFIPVGRAQIEPLDYEYEQTCEFVTNASGQVVANCHRVVGSPSGGPFGGVVCPGGEKYTFGNNCLRIPTQRAGGSISLRGFNFITRSVKVHLRLPDDPSLPPIVQDCAVWGDRVTAQKDEQGKVIADDRVSDCVDVPIPSAHRSGAPLAPGLYEIWVSVSGLDTGTGLPVVRESNVLLLRIEPNENVRYRFRSDRGRCIKETPGAGDDEIWWDAFVGHIVPRRETIEGQGSTPIPVTMERVSFPREPWKDMDDGDSATYTCTIFGPPPPPPAPQPPPPFALDGVLVIAIVGFEVDNEAAAREQLQGFWNSYYEVLKDIALVALTVEGTIAGVAALGGGEVALAVGLAALIYGGAITLVAAAFWSAWAPADLIALDVFCLDAQTAWDCTDPKKPLPIDTTRQFGGTYDEEDVLVKVTQRALPKVPDGSSATWVQENQYTAFVDGDEEASYALEFRLTRTSV